MKKALLMIFMLSLSIWGIFSAEIYIMPKSGAFGVYLGSDDYTGGDRYQQGGTLESHDADKYVDDMIIATVTIGEILLETAFPINVSFSVDCPEGLYFISQQGEGSRRPFELKVIPKIRTTYERVTANRHIIGGDYYNIENTGEFSDDYVETESPNGPVYEDAVVLSDGGRTSETIMFDSEPTPTSSFHTDYEFVLGTIHYDKWEPRYHVLIFDVILVLPFESITSTGVLTTDRGTYQLVQAEDYTALVTLNVSYNGKSQSVTIPFSGYFSLNDSAKREGSANLYVSPTSAASNLSIENDWGRAKTVASMNFLATYDSNANSDYRIFLSASNDPTTRSQYGFELVHEDVTPLQPHTSNNSIGYTLELSGTAGNYDPLTPVEFEGYAHINNSGQIEDENGVVSVEINPNTIYEDYRTNDYLNETWPEGDSRRYTPTVTYEYEGDINVIIDEPVNINAMLPGRYYSDIYVHVVDLGA